MANKIFVGGLNRDTKDQGLQDAFAHFGDITEAKVIQDRDSGRSRGFGFVTFDAEDAVQKAITEMNGTELDGNTIKVDQAAERGGKRR